MRMTLEEATQFFSDLFGGRHHIPGNDYAEKNLKPYGEGWSVLCTHDLATYDGSLLTRLVFLAHDRAYRASVMPARPKEQRIAIWKRGRDGQVYDYHPTLDQAVKLHRGRFPDGQAPPAELRELTDEEKSSLVRAQQGLEVYRRQVIADNLTLLEAGEAPHNDELERINHQIPVFTALCDTIRAGRITT